MKTFNVGDRVQVLKVGEFHPGTVTIARHHQQIWTVKLEAGGLAIAWGEDEIKQTRKKKC
jgi:hypothetical protein